MKNKMISKIICFFAGHGKPVPMLKEDYHIIYTRCCPRCEKPSIFSGVWKNCPPPPNFTPEQQEEFKKGLEIYFDEVRRTLEK